MKNSYDTYKGHRIPDPESFNIPQTNTDKIPLGRDGYTEASNGQTVHNIVAAIHNRMAEGLAPFVLITGESQMGKTYAALRIAYELHEVTEAAHNIFQDENILYNEREALNSMTCNFRDNMPARKQVLLGDELGEQANANQHNSTENMAWKMILNVMPLLKNCIIGLDPQSQRIDAKIREKPVYKLWTVRKGVIKGKGRRYNGVGKNGQDKWSVDYFSEWDVPKPPERYLKFWKPKELRFKLKKPIEFLMKLKEEDEGQTTSFDDF